MLGLGLNELIIIGIFIIVLFYGSDKILEIAKSAGKVTGEYKKSKLAAEKELRKAKNDLDLK